MEAVQRLPMNCFDLKVSPESSSFGPKLKQYIAEVYHEDPESYSNEIRTLEALRASAVRPVVDVTGCQTLKRYFCQLHFLQSRFPMSKGDPAAVTFSWKDVYANLVCSMADIRFELVSILYNIGALHSQLGAADSRSTPEGMKMACTHFQCAAWAFQHLRQAYPQPTGVDLAPDIMNYMQQLSLAQAQECILEKSMLDNRKAMIIAKVAVQVVDYYTQALNILQNGGEEGTIGETVGNRIYKDWSKYIKFKVSYFTCIALLYQGQQAEEQQKMGERVSFYNAACQELENAKKLSKGFDQHIINEALSFVTDVAEGKRKAAKNENEFIYHEQIPEINALQQVKGAALVKGIAFNFNDPEVAGADIFGRLVPMQAHEASSLYSEEKAQLLRKVSVLIEDKDTQLTSLMSSLHLDPIVQTAQIIHSGSKMTKLPQEIVDRAAALSAKPDAIKTLVQLMASLANLYHDVESMLDDVNTLLKKEEFQEKKYQQAVGSRPPSMVATELKREAGKYKEAHSKASESNQTLHKAMTLHVNNLKLLSQPLNELSKHIPTLTLPDKNINIEGVKELHNLLNKVDEMRQQRVMLVNQMRESITQDDITNQIITKPAEKPLDSLFEEELQKHQKYIKVIEQNLTAQDNILRALTDSYAAHSETRKIITDVLKQRETTIIALTSSFDAYDDLITKANKGIEFYKKLETNVSKLLQRVKSICKVQDEERDTILSKNKSPVHETGPKLKDYLASESKVLPTTYYYGKNSNQTPYYEAGVQEMSQSNLPSIRPTPLGSEETKVNPSTSSYNEPYTNAQIQNYYVDKNMSDYLKNLNIKGETSQAQFPIQSGQISYNNTQSYGYSQAKINQNYSVYTSEASAPISSIRTGQSYTSNNYPTEQQKSYYYPPENTPQFTDYGQNVYYNQFPNQGYNQQSQIQQGGSTYPQNVQETPSLQKGQASYNQNMGYNQQEQQGGSTYPQNVQDGSVLQQGQLNYNQNMGYTQQEQHGQGGSTYSQNVQDLAPQNQPNYTQNASYNQPTQDGSTQIQQGVSTYPQDLGHQNQPNYVQNTSYNQPIQDGSTQGQQGVSAYPQNVQDVSQNQMGQPMYTQNDNLGAQIPPGVSYPQNITYNQNLQEQQKYVPSQEKSTLGVQIQVGVSTYPQSIPYSQQEQQNYAPESTAMTNTYNNQVYTSYTPNLYYEQQGGQVYPPSTNVSQPTVAYYSQNEGITTQSGAKMTQAQNIPFSEGHNPNNPPEVATSPSLCASYTHPGYSFDLNTGQYQYGSGYQNASQNWQNLQNYAELNQNSQYTSAGTYCTSQTESQGYNNGPESAGQDSAYLNYYTMPYGYQGQQDGTVGSYNETSVQPQNPMTYMHSHSSNTNITNSKSEQKISSEEKIKSEPSNVDLLADIDFNINTAPLIPQTSTKQQNNNTNTNTPPPEIKKSPKNVEEITAIPKKEEEFIKKESETVIIQAKKDPLADVEVLSQFTQDVEKFEKFVEGLTNKTLNGPTPLDIKWKELQDLQEKDLQSHIISVARCYPMKNRFADILPYDHSRVELPSTKDDYINASYIKNLTPCSPPFIVTQAPLPSTFSDFWTMVWEQQSEVIICLLSDAEMKGQIYWPNERGNELEIGRMKVSLESINVKPNWTERILGLCLLETRVTRVIIHLQFTSWPGSSFPASPGPLLGFCYEVRAYYNQQRSSNHPLVIHCEAGIGRSGLLCLLISTLDQPAPLPDIVKLISEMSRQRKQILRDREHLKFAYQAVLYHAQDLLMKRGILTSRSTFEEATLRKSSHTRHPSQDLLLGQVERSGSQLSNENIGRRDSNISQSSILSGRDSPVEASGKSKTKFKKVTDQNTSKLPADDTNDPLNSLDPLWSIKK